MCMQHEYVSVCVLVYLCFREVGQGDLTQHVRLQKNVVFSIFY